MASTKTWKSAQLPAILTASREQDVVEKLRQYFQSGTFSGASFERLGGGGDRPDVADLITADDLLALALLSVPVGGFVARELLLRPMAQQVSDLLRAIPRDASIETEEGRRLLCDRAGAASRLWDLLRRAGDAAPPEMQRSQAFGPVRPSKLLARKRPHLFPIYDSVVADQFRVSSSAGQWRYLSDQFACAKHPVLVDRSLTDHLRHLRQSAGLDESISLLRVLDVAVWMDGAHASESDATAEAEAAADVDGSVGDTDGVSKEAGGSSVSSQGVDVDKRSSSATGGRPTPRLNPFADQGAVVPGRVTRKPLEGWASGRRTRRSSRVVGPSPGADLPSTGSASGRPRGRIAGPRWDS